MNAMKKQNGHGDTSSDTAVSLKKGDFTTPSVDPIFQKENGGLKCNISKPPFCAARPNKHGLVVYASADIIKRTEPINRVPVGYGLSALRLCVWLFDNCCMKLFYFDDRFVLAPRTKQRKVFKDRVFHDFCFRFCTADWAEYPLAIHVQTLLQPVSYSVKGACSHFLSFNIRTPKMI